MLASVLEKRTDLPRPNGLRQVVGRVCGAQIRLFLSAALCAAMAALPLRAAELAHRWSFVSDFSDSAGGADATPCGTYVSLYGGRVHTGYGGCTHGTGYVNLGTNVLDASSATLEIWARHDGAKNWSRVFDYGSDNSHYFILSWTYGTTLSKDRAGAKNPAEVAVDGTMAPYEFATDYHIAVTFERQGDDTFVRWQRRDAATGLLQKSGSATIPGGIHGFADPVLYLGHSQYTGDRDAMAAYDEVRVWRGVLADEQLAASAAAGPDAAISVVSGAPHFTPAAAIAPPAQRAPVPDGGYRLMTYNIQYCYDEKGTIVPDRTAARIIAENPDFCCLNECRDENAYPEATKLARLTGMHLSSAGGNGQGNALLSKEAPLFTAECELPWTNYSRYLLVCEFTNIVVAATHLDVDSSGASAKASRLESVAKIRETLAPFFAGGKPVMLAGDWNCKPNSEEIAAMREFMTILSPTNGVRTYHNHSATGAGSVIDYIAVDSGHTDDLYDIRSYVVEDIVTSDHNPVVAEFHLRPPASALGWIDERYATTGRTGTWVPGVAWDAASRTAALGGGHDFTPARPSDGRVATIDLTAVFRAECEGEPADPAPDAQAAIRLGANGRFQVWTAGEVEGLKVEKLKGDGVWVDVAAEGVTPRGGTEYTFRFSIDYASRRYAVELLDGGSATPLADAANPTRRSFPLAADATRVSAIRFDGETRLASLFGAYEGTLPGSGTTMMILR